MPEAQISLLPMLKRVALTTGALVLCGAAAFLHPQQPFADWPKVAAAADAYAQRPNCENAQTLIDSIPDRTPRSADAVDGRTVERIYRHLDLLQAQMFRGDACATRVAFRLRRIADAAFGEDLDVALGSLATTRPMLFLRELERSGQPCEVVTTLDTDFTAAEARAELTLRLSRLQERVPPSLVRLRNECLRQLQKSAK